jgi:cytochrome bd-type quinol oxidase subunit 1
MMIGDTVARDMFQEMRVKFAAIETVWTTGPDRPETSWGRLNQDPGEISDGLPIPDLASWLPGFSTSTVITGLSGYRRRPVALGQGNKRGLVARKHGREHFSLSLTGARHAPTRGRTPANASATGTIITRTSDSGPFWLDCHGAHPAPVGADDLA